MLPNFRIQPPALRAAADTDVSETMRESVQPHTNRRGRP